MKRLVTNLLKFGVSGAILAWVVYDASREGALDEFVRQPKDWGQLTLAWLFCFAAVVLTMIRWHLLVRALGLPFRIQDAFRLGFLGYLLNFVSLGAVGGDLFKAVFVARELHGRRAEAVATVVVDRIVGLYAMFVVASIALVLTGQLSSPVREVVVICQGTLIATAVGAAGILVMLIPGFTSGALSEFLAKLPKIGGTLDKLLGAVRMYRRRPGMLFLSGLMSMGVHALSTIGIWLVAHGMPGATPSLATHFVVVPLAMVTGILPLPVNGLGAFEAVLDFLYLHVGGAGVVKGQGLIVALGYRVITIVIAMVGVGYYVAARREVQQVMVAAAEEAAGEKAALS